MCRIENISTFGFWKIIISIFGIRCSCWCLSTSVVVVVWSLWFVTNPLHKQDRNCTTHLLALTNDEYNFVLQVLKFLWDGSNLRASRCNFNMYSKPKSSQEDECTLLKFLNRISFRNPLSVSWVIHRPRYILRCW